MGLLDRMDNLPIPCLCQMSVSVSVALSFRLHFDVHVCFRVSVLVSVSIYTLLTSVVLYSIFPENN
jgi:hypothetical protein